ncbi:hypothetical protein [Pantoea sp. B65]|uniref:hypothetical protein n=1 Tax=Pantoea sp. B65 TaxID=2813359 RepID=UPI0039B63C4C
MRTDQPADFDDEALFLARQRLYDAARSPDEQPFLLLLSLTHPHDPFTIPRRYLDRFKPEEIDLPQTSAQDVADDRHSARRRAMYYLLCSALSAIADKLSQRRVINPFSATAAGTYPHILCQKA